MQEKARLLESNRALGTAQGGMRSTSWNGPLTQPFWRPRYVCATWRPLPTGTCSRCGPKIFALPPCGLRPFSYRPTVPWPSFRPKPSALQTFSRRRTSLPTFQLRLWELSKPRVSWRPAGWHSFPQWLPDRLPLNRNQTERGQPPQLRPPLQMHRPSLRCHTASYCSLPSSLLRHLPGLHPSATTPAASPSLSGDPFFLSEHHRRRDPLPLPRHRNHRLRLRR